MNKLILCVGLLLATSHFSFARVLLANPGCYSVQGHYTGFSDSSSEALLSVLTGSRSEHKVRIAMAENPGILTGVKVRAYLSVPSAGNPDQMKFKATKKAFEVLSPSENIVLNTWQLHANPARCAQ
ncbi:hypothetical protein GW915_09180 [bacterium]|nr:hypothetical protein [bacterium]